MKKYYLLIISSIVLLVLTVFLSIKISSSLNQYREKQEETAEVLDFKERLADPWEWSPIFNNGEEKEEQFFELRAEADKLYAEALRFGYYLYAMVFVFILANVFAAIRKDDKDRVFGLTLIIASFMFLYLGLTSPFLELEFYNLNLTLEADLELFTLDQEFPGRTYYLYQNKSIIELISLLYNGGNYLVSISLLIFSILFPIIKLLASLAVLTYPHGRRSKKLVGTINSLGKWSMIDVFVSSIILAFFSFANMNVGVDTGSTTLIGTWFFMTFVVLSISSGIFLKRVTSKIIDK